MIKQLHGNTMVMLKQDIGPFIPLTEARKLRLAVNTVDNVRVLKIISNTHCDH